MLPSDVKHLAADSEGSVFASDGGRRIARLAAGWIFDVGALPADARISAIAGLPGGGVVIADTWLNQIWQMDARGRILSVAGVEQLPGLHRRAARSDGPLGEARFRSPCAIAASAAGDVFVAEPCADHVVIRTIAGGSVSSAEIAGVPPAQLAGLAFVDGTLFAVFGAEGPPAIVVLRRDAREGASGPAGRWCLNSIVGSRTERGSADGSASTARFVAPAAVAATPDGCAVADGARLRTLSGANRVNTLAGSIPGFLDARGNLARFGRLRAVAAVPAGGFIVADPENDAIRSVSTEGDVNTIIGAIRSERISRSNAGALSKCFGNALVDDDVHEAWGLARLFLRDHRIGGETWPDRTIQPTSVASARLGKELAEAWSRDADPDRSGVGMFCLWLIGCEERAQGVNEIRDHRLRRAGEELDRRAG